MSTSADDSFDGDVQSGTEVWRVCPDCDGEGSYEDEVCEMCGGDGGWRL